jgi:PAS domain S-box-containing protein
MHIPAAQDYSLDANRVELLLDAIADYAIYMLDPDGFITTWNAAAERIKGYQAVEIVGQHFSRFFTPEDRASGLPERILENAKPSGGMKPRVGASAKMEHVSGLTPSPSLSGTNKVR